jgi:hypothetical protein
MLFFKLKVFPLSVTLSAVTLLKERIHPICELNPTLVTVNTYKNKSTLQNITEVAILNVSQVEEFLNGVKVALDLLRFEKYGRTYFINLDFNALSICSHLFDVNLLKRIVGGLCIPLLVLSC